MNLLEPVPLTPQACPSVEDPARIAESFQEYLGDESRLRAPTAEALYFPETPGQVAGAFTALAAANRAAVISGGRTGITGAAAPIEAKAVVSLEKMKRLLAVGHDAQGYYARVEPGLSLADLNAILARRATRELPAATPKEAQTGAEYAAGQAELWFPVDPTEQTAHLGGVVASNASGARTFRYGATRPWVRAVRVILADGRELRLRRGQVRAENGRLRLSRTEGGETEIQLPTVQPPAVNKATLGYDCRPDVDAVDLFVGSEGTLGALVEIELRLAERPASVLGVLAVVASEEQALTLVELARARRDELGLEALEYFDHDTLVLLKKKKDEDGPGSHLPEIPSWDGAAVYLELAGTEEETEAACEPLEEILGQAGSSLDETWAAMEPDELERQKLFRHAVPEAVNSLIGQRKAKIPELHKIGTDMAVPDAQLREVFSMYRRGLAEAGLQSVVFGHIGDNHVHVNILPASAEELKKAKALYLDWARQIVALGGAVAAEHGIGRIKKSMLELQYPPAILDQMRALRRAFDPAGRLAPGVLV